VGTALSISSSLNHARIFHSSLPNRAQRTLTTMTSSRATRKKSGPGKVKKEPTSHDISSSSKHVQLVDSMDEVVELTALEQEEADLLKRLARIHSPVPTKRMCHFNEIMVKTHVLQLLCQIGRKAVRRRRRRRRHVRRPRRQARRPPFKPRKMHRRRRFIKEVS